MHAKFGFLRARPRLAALAAICAAGVVMLLAVNDRAEGGPPSPTELAGRLQDAAVESFDPATGVFADVETIRAQAAAALEQVPFPPSRNSAAKLDWAAQGTLTRGDVQLLVQANAMCDWIEYTLETAQTGRLTASTRDILQSIPAWPAVRGLPFNQELSDAIAAVSAGDLGPLKELHKRACIAPKPPAGDRSE